MGDPRPRPKKDHWEPEPKDREYFRNRQTGELGYKVIREGVSKIRKDRPMEDLCTPYSDTQWKPEEERRPLTEYQLARIAFAADKEVCTFLGLHERSRREWLSMQDGERSRWVQDGPSEEDDATPERVMLYESIMVGLAELVD